MYKKERERESRDRLERGVSALVRSLFVIRFGARNSDKCMAGGNGRLST